MNPREPLSNASSKGASGGAAASAGSEFQARVAAFFGVAMLSEQLAVARFDLPEGVRVEAVRCEQVAAVDDVGLATSDAGRVELQAKNRVTASKGERSPLAGALGQFVNAFLDARDGVDPRGALSKQRDRLVLACGPTSSASVRRALPALLERLREDPLASPDELTLRNKDERTIWPLLLMHLRRVFAARTDSDPTPAELTELLSLIRVREFEFDGAGRDTEAAKTALASTVLAEPAQAELAWQQVVALMLNAASGQRGLRREALAQRLAGAGVQMLAAPSFRTDVERLRSETERSRAVLRRFGEIELSSGAVKITRSVAAAARARAEEAPCLVISVPGGGKSGVVSDVVEALLCDAQDVVALAADSYKVADEAGLAERLGLEHRLADVLAAWPGERKGVLVIDGLDAARGGDGLAVFTSLIETVAARDGRWTVLASIRSFDLRYNPRLQEAFRQGAGALELVDSEFAGTRHLLVPELDAEEIGQAAARLPRLAELLDGAPEDLRQLARNPFNLARLAELLEAGAASDELRPLRTRLELLEVYWKHRVLSPADGADNRVRLARTLCDIATRAPALFAVRADVATGEENDAAIRDLLGSGVLVEAQSQTGADTLAFSHHVLFDYAVARLMLRVDRLQLAELVRARPELALVARPSFTLHFQYLWEQQREMFWPLTLELSGDESLPLLGRIVAPAVAADAASADDLDPLIGALSSGGERREHALAALVHVVGAALAGGSDGRPLQKASVRVWASFADRLSEHLDDHIATQLRILTWGLIAERERLGEDELAAVGRVGRRLLRRALDNEPYRFDLVYVGLDAVAATYATDPQGSRDLLGRFVAPERMARLGWQELSWVMDALFTLRREEPELVARLYASAFAAPEPDGTAVPMGGPVTTLISNRGQDFRVALTNLAERFPLFLKDAPEAAVGALIDVCRATGEQRSLVAEAPERELRWQGQAGTVIDAFSVGLEL
jgi:hypothetical protein